MTIHEFDKAPRGAKKKFNDIISIQNVHESMLANVNDSRLDKRQVWRGKVTSVISILEGNRTFQGQFFMGDGETPSGTDVEIVCPKELTEVSIDDTFLALRKYIGVVIEEHEEVTISVPTSSWFCIAAFGVAAAGDLVVITRSLAYADPESENPDGISEYWGSLLGGPQYVAWNVNTIYVLGDKVSFNGHIYIKTNIESGQEGIPSPNDNSSNVWWDIVEDLVLKGLAREGDGVFFPPLGDLRNYNPWCVVGDIVPVIIIDGEYYIAQTLIPCGSETNSSIRWNQESGRMMAVFK